jgi:hypothetical protein
MGGMSGDSRIDGSSSRAAMPSDEGSCDQTRMLCGAKPPERLASEAPPPEVSHPGDDWRIPELPPEQPAHVAAVAKNMASAASSAPKPHAPTDAELRAGYEKMSDAQLQQEVQRLTVRLTRRGPSSDTELDTARFHAAESVVKKRNDQAAARAEAEKVEGWRVPSLRTSVGAQGAVYEDENVTVMGAHTKVSPAGVDTGGSALHVHGERHFGAVTVSGRAEALGAGYDAGVHNRDGSTGVHGGGGATAVGAEVTVGVKGHGSLTLGKGLGQSAELSVGLKKDADTTDLCVRVDMADWLGGACVPWRM